MFLRLKHGCASASLLHCTTKNLFKQTSKKFKDIDLFIWCNLGQTYSVLSCPIKLSLEMANNSPSKPSNRIPTSCNLPELKAFRLTSVKQTFSVGEKTRPRGDCSTLQVGQLLLSAVAWPNFTHPNKGASLFRYAAFGTEQRCQKCAFKRAESRVQHEKRRVLPQWFLKTWETGRKKRGVHMFDDKVKHKSHKSWASKCSKLSSVDLPERITCGLQRITTVTTVISRILAL